MPSPAASSPFAVLDETCRNGALIAYARKIAATHIVRGLREARDFTEEFNLHGVAGRIDPSIPYGEGE
jgi:phosphopantetheine adenylyltransferase